MLVQTRNSPSLSVVHGLCRSVLEIEFVTFLVLCHMDNQESESHLPDSEKRERKECDNFRLCAF